MRRVSAFWVPIRTCVMKTQQSANVEPRANVEDRDPGDPGPRNLHQIIHDLLLEPSGTSGSIHRQEGPPWAIIAAYSVLWHLWSIPLDCGWYVWRLKPRSMSNSEKREDWNCILLSAIITADTPKRGIRSSQKASTRNCVKISYRSATGWINHLLKGNTWNRGSLAKGQWSRNGLCRIVGGPVEHDCLFPDIFCLRLLACGALSGLAQGWPNIFCSDLRIRYADI